MNLKKLVLIFGLGFFLGIAPFIGQASERSGGQTGHEPASEHGDSGHGQTLGKGAHTVSAGHGADEKSQTGHGDKQETGHGEEHHPAAPFSYYLHWALILIMFVTVIRQDMAIYLHPNGHTDEHGHDGHGHTSNALPLMFICFVALMFLLENFSAMAHYHQANSLALIKWLIMMACGALIMLYGLSFKH